MKLSDMNTEQLMDALCRMAEPLERIGRDEGLCASLAALAKADKAGQTRFAQGCALAGALIPPLLARHREDTLTVLSALTGQSAEALKAQSGLETLKTARSVFCAELTDFF